MHKRLSRFGGYRFFQLGGYCGGHFCPCLFVRQNFAGARYGHFFHVGDAALRHYIKGIYGVDFVPEKFNPDGGGKLRRENIDNASADGKLPLAVDKAPADISRGNKKGGKGGDIVRFAFRYRQGRLFKTSSRNCILYCRVRHCHDDVDVVFGHRREHGNPFVFRIVRGNDIIKHGVADGVDHRTKSHAGKKSVYRCGGLFVVRYDKSGGRRYFFGNQSGEESIFSPLAKSRYHRRRPIFYP